MILSSELIRARRTKEKLIPLFATSEKRSLAKTLVEIYKEHIDMKRWELQEALDSCEELGYDFKLVRGISEILNSHCIYGVRSFVPPLKARALLFQEAVKENVLSKARRDIILTRVADILQIKTNELEDSMYADLLDEQRLTDFSEITPDDLMKTYNFALICAILTYANKIDFTINSKVIGLTEVANALGEADFKGTTQIKAGIKLKPMKHVSLRGSKIETLLSLIMDSKEWALRADVAYPPRYRDTKPVELDSKGLGTQLKAKKAEEELIIEVKAPIRQSSFGDIIVLDDVDIIPAPRKGSPWKPSKKQKKKLRALQKL